MPPPVCPYCGAVSKLVHGDIIYPHRPDLREKMFWRCSPCNAYVGCHPVTSSPLGSLANAHLRRARNMVHAIFDPLWKEKHMTRTGAYQWLASQLGVPVKECHVGMFDIDMCRKAWKACQQAKQRKS